MLVSSSLKMHADFLVLSTGLCLLPRVSAVSSLYTKATCTCEDVLQSHKSWTLTMVILFTFLVRILSICDEDFPL